MATPDIDFPTNIKFVSIPVSRNCSILEMFEIYLDGEMIGTMSKIDVDHWRIDSTKFGDYVSGHGRNQVQCRYQWWANWEAYAVLPVLNVPGE